MRKGQPLRRTRFLSRCIRVLSSINGDSSNLIFQNWQIFLEKDPYNHRVRVQKGEKIVPSCVYFPRKTSYREVSLCNRQWR